MVSVRALLLVATLALSLLSGVAASDRTLPQDAYVWQRKWTPALRVALKESSDLVRAWRVLAAYTYVGGNLQPVAVDWKALKDSGRPVIAVVRIDGQLRRWDDNRLLTDLDGLLSRWRHTGAPIAGLEIDNDCAVARLAMYAQFLALVRSHLDPKLSLSITALPAWLRSPELGAVLAPVTQAVLQVHMVQKPHAGLFNPEQARRWTQAMACVTSKPFLVAVPAYGVRVSWRGDGRMLTVEGENQLLVGGAWADEMIVSPEDVAKFLEELQVDRPAGLAGIIWFRLPVSGDIRAWSSETWRAVASGKPLHPDIEARAEKSDTPGMSDIVLINEGDTDATLPPRIDLPPACTIADGVNGYTLDRTESGLTIKREQDGLLPGHRRRLIGWMRCNPPEVAIDAQR
jgi:hypothetical protein